ncbi:leucine-rich repeat protein [Flavobacterium cerinum]|uniref:Leucine-rich repeat domain-containing protein n=1 Tax=Flavobacterium cerinum TaxID=2502784 RepID=A0ABY5IQC4_9FLAO|nr:leucine-rich repeat protein [Flavobacterium cerinum]UUC44407.1 leucine-rich repeat domain-containing protein [Flavobacterium cerinum]
MEIQSNKLISIDSDDIKDGVLYLPESVETIGDKVIQNQPELVTVVAPWVTVIEDDNFNECNALIHFEASVLTTIGNGNFYECNALTRFEAPRLTTMESLNFHCCNALTHFDVPELTLLENDNFQECNALSDFTAPVLTTIRHCNFEDCNALISFEAPMLKEMEIFNFKECKALTNFKASALTFMDRSNFYKCDALTDFEAPMLDFIGNENFKFCYALRHFKAPMLRTIGRENFFACALTNFDVPELTYMGTGNFEECDTLTDVRFGKYNYSVKSVDRVLTIIEKSETLNGMLIHTGFILNNCYDGVPNVTETVLVEKDGFFAHGETLKQAIEDLQFKIIAKEIKKEPIHEDTVITEAYYKTITGACTQGVKQWREQNNISQESFIAKELLPILEKTNAYGIEKFKALITFENR